VGKRQRALPADDQDLFAREGHRWSRERVKAFLLRRYSPRLHMSMILATSGLVAMLASWILLNLGVGSMLVRYPITVALAYGTFIVGVWAWLRAMGLRDNSNASRKLVDSGSLDFPTGGGGSGGSGAGGGGGNIGLPRGGGSFDGGGASSSWSGGPRMNLSSTNLQPDAPVQVTSSGGKGFGLDFGDALDGDAIVLLILAAALVLVVVATSGYLIWIAPDVLSEAAFGAILAGTLARPTRKQTASGWVAGVVRKTWWPFAVVFAMATGFAWFAHAHFPQAQTFKQAIALALR
jgi:hypothetical protein